MLDAPLIITPQVQADLHKLRDAAARNPIDMPHRVTRLHTPRGRRLHMQQMDAQTVEIPGPWPFSIETGHPSGAARHVSVSIAREGRVPGQYAVWMICEELGFGGGLEACQCWPEKLEGGGTAVNVIQPLSVQQAANV
jgi:hypothetical protein